MKLSGQITAADFRAMMSGTREPGEHKSTMRPREIPEETIQHHIISALRRAGMRVLQTTHQLKFTRCPECGHTFRPNGGYGSSLGVPDLLTRSLDSERGTWVGIEVKGRKTRLSEVQKELEEEGSIIVCRSVDEAMTAMGLD